MKDIIHFIGREYYEMNICWKSFGADTCEYLWGTLYISQVKNTVRRTVTVGNVWEVMSVNVVEVHYIFHR